MRIIVQQKNRSDSSTYSNSVAMDIQGAVETGKPLILVDFLGDFLSAPYAYGTMPAVTL